MSLSAESTESKPPAKENSSLNANALRYTFRINFMHLYFSLGIWYLKQGSCEERG